MVCYVILSAKCKNIQNASILRMQHGLGSYSLDSKCEFFFTFAPLSPETVVFRCLLRLVTIHKKTKRGDFHLFIRQPGSRIASQSDEQW